MSSLIINISKITNTHNTTRHDTTVTTHTYTHTAGALVIIIEKAISKVVCHDESHSAGCKSIGKLDPNRASLAPLSNEHGSYTTNTDAPRNFDVMLQRRGYYVI